MHNAALPVAIDPGLAGNVLTLLGIRNSSLFEPRSDLVAANEFPTCGVTSWVQRLLRKLELFVPTTTLPAPPTNVLFAVCCLERGWAFESR